MDTECYRSYWVMYKLTKPSSFPSWSRLQWGTADVENNVSSAKHPQKSELFYHLHIQNFSSYTFKALQELKMQCFQLAVPKPASTSSFTNFSLNAEHFSHTNYSLQLEWEKTKQNKTSEYIFSPSCLCFLLFQHVFHNMAEIFKFHCFGNWLTQQQHIPTLNSLTQQKQIPTLTQYSDTTIT